MGASEPALDNALARILAPESVESQPALLTLPPITLHAAVASLAIGGAERIVLDWAAAAARHHPVRLIVLRKVAVEWQIPAGIECLRLQDANSAAQLCSEGVRIAASGNPQILCHLLSAAERNALQRGGAQPIPVLHNARAGWIEPANELKRASWMIAVSRAAAADLQASGLRNVAVVHHLPAVRSADAAARQLWRKRWMLPQDAFVIGMIGGVKPQKAYPRALRILAALLERRTAYLVILGGPTGRDGLLAWRAIVEQSVNLDVAAYVRLPGFVAEAQCALPAFDAVLNTSRYEGLSIATLEALACGLPVLASKVGGQGEISAPGLRLLPYAAPVVEWAAAIERSAASAVDKPQWVSFPSARLWTLMHLPLVAAKRAGTLFVTANLNAGGAQRSLVNLATALVGQCRFEIAVCGDSTSDAFMQELRACHVPVVRSACTRDAFDHAEAIVRYASEWKFRSVVFWNVDPKVKLLVTKRLAQSPLRLIDASPGAYAFEEMNAVADFQTWIAFSARDYYARLDRLVLKHHGAAPAHAKLSVIPNGVRIYARRERHGQQQLRKIAVSGRIAPSKFLLEIVQAMRIVWLSCPDAELHVLGTAETRHRDYAQALLIASLGEIGRRIFLHGAVFDAPQRLAEFDVALVIGHHQGSPNAVLEALAAGLAVVANDSGGTREAVIDGSTGVLLTDREPATIAAGLLRVLQDPRLSERLAHHGRRHVERHFSMRAMLKAYRKLLI